MMKTILLNLFRGALAVAVFGGMVGVYNYLLATKPEVAAEPRQEQIWTVAATEIQQRDAAPILTAFGTVTAARSADLRFGSAGEVSMISPKMRNGVAIDKGEVLARLDDVRYQLALEEVKVQIEGETVNIASLKRQVALRQKQLERTRKMVARNVATDANLDEVDLALTIAENQLNMSLNRLSQLQVAKKSREQDIEDTILRAPFAGTLSTVSIGLGKRASNAAAVAQLTDQNSLEVPFSVSADIFANAAELIGQNVDVSWRTGGQDVALVPATITRAEAIVDKSQGGGQLYAVLDTSDAGTIPPGAFVEVRFVGRVLNAVFELPEEALVNNAEVYVIQDGRTERREVTAEYRADGRVWVSGALKPGEQIVSSRLPGIGPGMMVRIAGAPDAS